MNLGPYGVKAQMKEHPSKSPAVLDYDPQHIPQTVSELIRGQRQSDSATDNLSRRSQYQLETYIRIGMPMWGDWRQTKNQALQQECQHASILKGRFVVYTDELGEPEELDGRI